MKILSVLIEYRVSSLNTPFTYVCDDNVNILKGCRVYVPFGYQNIVGYVIDVKHSSLSLQELNKQDNIEYKYIHSVLDEKPILSEELFNLALYMSKEYVCPLISCLQTILPPTYKPSSSALKQLTYKKLKKAIANEGVDVSKLKDNQKALYELIKNNNGMFIKDLPSSVLTLEKHGYVKFIYEIVVEDYFKDYKVNPSKRSLNEEQQKAFDKIINSDKDVFLLQGVTGSGKTEVYLSLVEHYVKQNKTAIVLVPEISLTPMIIQRFKEKFNNVAVLHGSLSKKEN